VWYRCEKIEEVFGFSKPKAATGQRTEPYIICHLRRHIEENQLPRVQDNSICRRCVHFFCYELGRGFLNRIESAADKISASLNFGLTLSEKTKPCVFSKNNKVLKTQVRRDNVNSIIKYNKRSLSIRIQEEIIANSR